MLRNEKYKGTYTFNKANGKNTQGRRTKNQKKREDQIIRTKDVCPAIVSEDLFDRVQDKLKKRTTMAKKSKGIYMLADNDRLSCECCGKKLRGNIKYSGRNKTEYKTYVCNGHRGKGCSTKDIQTKYLDDFILWYIHRLFFSKKMKPYLLKQLNAADHTLTDGDRQQLQTCKFEINKKNKEIRRLLNLAVEGCKDTEITDRMKKVSNEKRKLEKEIDRLKKGKKKRTFTEEDIVVLEKMFVEYLKENDTVATRMFMQDVVEDVIVGNDEITVTLNVA